MLLHRSEDVSLIEARATTKRVARTFAIACRLLPRGLRDDVYRLYLVFRTLDDLVDERRCARATAHRGRRVMVRGSARRLTRGAAARRPRAPPRAAARRDRRLLRRHASRPRAGVDRVGDRPRRLLLPGRRHGRRRHVGGARRIRSGGATARLGARPGDAAHEHPARHRRGPRDGARLPRARDARALRLRRAAAAVAARGAAARPDRARRRALRARLRGHPPAAATAGRRSRPPARCTARSCARSSATATTPARAARSCRASASCSSPRARRCSRCTRSATHEPAVPDAVRRARRDAARLREGRRAAHAGAGRRRSSGCCSAPRRPMRSRRAARRAAARSSEARPRWASRPSSPASRPGGRSGTTRTRRCSGASVGGVPLAAAAAWAMMARPAWVVAGLISRRRTARIALAAGALTAWDVFLDPRMVREGYWTWPAGGRYEGVPASNYLGWFATGAGVFAVWSLHRRRRRPVPRRRRRAAVVLVDMGRRVVANVVHLAPAARGRRGWRRDGRVRRTGAARAPAPRRMRVVVVGAGVGGLAAAARLATAGHDVVVLEQAATARRQGGALGAASGFVFDTRPVAADDAVGLRGAVRGHRRAVGRQRRADGRRAGDPLPLRRWQLGRAERRFAGDGRRARGMVARDGRRLGALPSASARRCGAPRRRFCRGRRRGRRGARRRARRRPIRATCCACARGTTLRTLARALTSDPRLQMVIERFATYAGADPRRAPAALAVAGYVEHAFGAWHVRGGIHGLVTALAQRLRSLGADAALRRARRRAGRCPADG